MRLRIPGWLAQRWQRWLYGRHLHGQQLIVLTQNRVYIFLSGSGLVYSIMLLAMLGGAINYDLALAYVLVFLLASMALVSIMYTFRNLLGLTLLPGLVPATFQGESARFEIILDNAGRQPRHNVHLFYGEATTAVDVPPTASTRAVIALPATQRGWLRAPRLKIETHWPLGVFRCWSYAYFDQRALVYPQPEAGAPPLPLPAEGSGSGVVTARGHDDFAGLRPFSLGDSPRHIAWKAAARDDELKVKEFHGEASRTLWLDWNALPALDVEPRLSRLCAWVLQAHAEGASFGLNLPGREITPGQGEAQRDACLAALALHGLREMAP